MMFGDLPGHKFKTIIILRKYVRLSLVLFAAIATAAAVAATTTITELLGKHKTLKYKVSI